MGDKPDIHQVVLEAVNSIRLDGESLKSHAFEYSTSYYEGLPNLPERERRSRGFQLDTEMRIFILKNLFKFLFGENQAPGSLVELGSAGDISAALAFPNTRVYPLDIDYDIFSNEVNHLPEEVFALLGIPKLVTYYGQTTPDNLRLVDRCLQNYRRVIGNGNNFPFRDNEFDVGLVQGSPHLLNDYFSELARVTKKGGYIMSVAEDFFKPADAESFYSTGKYGNWPEHGKTGTSGYPLVAIEIPKKFRELERLCEWKSERAEGQRLASGFVFEVFRKL
ncbi:MAG: methyltransferase domain-containing protein [Nanoarchaeota archaeon]